MRTVENSEMSAPAQKLPREPSWQTDANLLSFKANAAESSEVSDYLKTALVRCARVGSGNERELQRARWRAHAGDGERP